MKKLILAAVAVMTAMGAVAQKITVGPSETTELMSVIMHLSGADGYDHKMVWPEYKAIVDSVFAVWKEHHAVRLAREIWMRGNTGLNGSEAMAMAVEARIDNGLFTTTHTSPPDYGWSKEEHTKFIAAINDFYREIDFHKIYAERLAPMYDRTREQMERVYNSMIEVAWLKDFTGVELPMDRVVTICYLNGPYNYGLSADGFPRPVLGVKADVVEGRSNNHTYAWVLLHEFLHPYLNPLNERYFAELEPSGEVLAPPLRETMIRYGYDGQWRGMVYEALVNAAVVVYMRDHDTFESEADRIVAGFTSRGFYWVDRLADKLMEYQKQRDKYPTFESFMPEVVKFYNDLAEEQQNKHNS